MKKPLVTAAPLALLLAACSPRTTPPPAAAGPENTSTASAPQPASVKREDLATMLNRELDTLPALAEASGRGWSTQVPGRAVHVKPGTTEGTEEIDFKFEDSGPVECIVFAEVFDPGSYVGNIVEELKKSLQIVGFTPTRFTVEGEMPAYFASILYHKKSAEGVLGGQLKLALGLHASRPIVCLHDVPGYTATFESVARAVFANYRVADDTSPDAVMIGVARVGTMPIGFTRETARLLESGRTQFTTISAQIVPRSANELMVSDEAEVIVASSSKVEEAHYIQGDLRGEKMNLTLKALAKGKYEVTGTLGSKPTQASFATKGGLPSPDALSQRLKQEFARKKAFRFTQPEYHPSLDPSGLVQVSYAHEKSDGERIVHIGLGQLQMQATVDEEGDQLKYELKAGSQTIVFERVYQRDDRKRATGKGNAVKESPRP